MSSNAPPGVLTGRIHRIEVENFKSYKGHQVIGPFKNFTAIIGPNGAGKSNLMDAISFVLGVRSMQLRGSQLKDLIYAFDDKEREAKGRKAFVRLVYITGEGEELIFTRAITGSGGSEYRINNKSVTWDEYNEKMRSLGILVKARNFLVFQGDVESVASKSPKELTNLFEQISSSEDLKKDYEELEEQRTRAEEAAMFAFQKKKSTAAERKQKKEQKEEAEHHLQLLEELKTLKMEYSLWQLFGIEREEEKTAVELEEDKKNVTFLTAEYAKLEEEVKGKKKEQAVHQKELIICEKNKDKKKAELESKQPMIVKLREEMKRAQKKSQESEKQLKEKRLAVEEQDKLKATLQSQLDDAAAQQADLNAQSQSDETLHLAEDQLKEYHRIKEEAGSRTAKINQDKTRMVQQLRSDEDQLLIEERRLQEISKEEQQQQQEVERLSANSEKCAALVTESSTSLAECKKQLTELQRTHARTRGRYDVLRVQIEEAEAKLHEAKLNRHESERDARASEAVENMKRLFPGVRGRMTDIVKVSQKKYNLALTVTMGRSMDAVITDDYTVAKDCIKYLKDQRLPPMTFIPLHTVKSKPINGRLRTLGGTAKLLLDVVEYDRDFEKALIYGLGNTVVCDTLEEARALAYGEERHKVVTLDGTEFKKGGTMTGGTSGGMEAKAARWDAQQFEGVKRTRDKYQQEMSQMPSLREMDEKERQLQLEISSFERRVTYNTTAVTQDAERIKKAQQALKTLAKERERKQPDVDKLKASIAKQREDIAVLEKRINEIVDRIYGEFSKSVGVANIREYEENQLKQHEELMTRKMKLNTHISKIKNQLEYEQRRDLRGPIQKVEQAIQTAKEDIQRLKEAGATLKSTVDQLQAELNEMEAAGEELRKKTGQWDEELQELKQKQAKTTQLMAKAKRHIGLKETLLEQWASKRTEILETCELEQIVIPVLRGGDDEPTPMDTSHGSSSAEAAAAQRFDFSHLSRRHQQEVAGPEKEKLESEFKQKMEQLQLDIDKTAPNLKALEQYEALRDSERDQNEDFEKARREAKEVTDRFNNLKQQRYERFMSAFSHISTNINHIYKELTQSSTHPTGGTAYLSLENEDEPFLHGVKYTAMPPTKRFRDMDQLSGGEKTVAALALLFAIHAFRPSPFFVLDEVDAALDNLNVAKVAAFIRNKSREDAIRASALAGSHSSGGKSAPPTHSLGFQSVVISLKDYFYDKADALVGVYRDSEHSCSKTLTFDLTKYPS